MERTRRQPTVSANKAGKLSALAALKAARDGGSKRVAEFEVRQEAAVYDVLDEGDYAQHVAKRREEGGDFIVDDDGQGYAELGEEDDHWRSKGSDDEAGEGEGEEEEEAAGKAKKRKGAAKGDAKSRKKGPGQQAGAGNENIAKMFSKAAARAALSATTRVAKPVAAADSDALLADILGGIGTDADPAAAVAALPAPAATSLGVQRAGLGAGGAVRGAIARPGLARPGVGGVTAMAQPQRASNANNPFASVRSRQPTKAVASRNAAVVKMEADKSTHATQPQDHVQDPEDLLQDQMDVDPPAETVDDVPYEDQHEDQQETAAGDDSMGMQTEQAGGSNVAGDAPEEAAVTVGDSKAAGTGIGAMVQATSKAAAGGWASICEAVDIDEMEDMGDAPFMQEPAAATAVTVAAPSGSADATSGPALQTLPDGMVPFYFLDAYESPEGRPGEVFLFGKVPVDNPSAQRGRRTQAQTFASTCVVVKSCVRSVTVVPRPQVFEDTDGSIAELEASLAAANKEVQDLLISATRSDAEAARLLASSSRSATTTTKPNSTAMGTNNTKPSSDGTGTEGEEAAAKAAAEKAAKEAAAAAEAAAKKADQEATQAKVCQQQAVQQRAAAEVAKAKVAAAKLELIKLLHGKCADLKAELKQLLTRHGIKAYRTMPVKRTYAFELPDVPRGEQWCVKVRYPASDSMLPFGLSGQNFVAMFGTNTTCLESLLIKRKLKGPCWALLSGAQRVEYQDQVSWCKVELALPSPKSLLCDPHHPSITSRAAPPLTVASLNLKTLINPNNHQHEVVAAGVVYLSDRVDIEAPMTLDQWNKAELLRNFCVVRKLEGGVWPPGFEAAVAAENASWRGKLNGGAMLLLQTSERSLLTSLLAKLQTLDADVLVGHNISAFDLHVLLTRMQLHKVPLWSRIGRLKRTSMPKLAGGGHAYGGGASAGLMSAVAGRVLCDTYLSARELVREVDYTLKTLSQQLLGETRGELNAADVPAAFNSSQALMQLVSHAQSDAWLALRLMFHLSVLPLTRALTALSGFQWSKSLQGARAQRIEMLLLHEFHARKYLLPDKVPFANKDAKPGKKGQGAMKEEEGGPTEMDMDQPPEEEEGAAGKTKTGPKSKGPQYAGGLVLEPKKGLYDKMVIVLDFNSLYPSIIQEFNICFSTVERPKDGSLAALPASAGSPGALAPLPTILQNLVQQRRQVKSSMSSSRDPVQKQQLHIRQQALKLTANSMYGCLGFSSSRFYAKPLAELVTSQGRSILQSTVDLVQNSIGAEVIYGDTDSIMIHTGTTDLVVAHTLGDKIKKEVNKRYKLLEIELDATFRCMLLLKKKKYAAIKIEHAGNGQWVEVQEQKGLDIVRRDWCALSKDAGHAVLAEVLSCRPCEEVVAVIHDKMREVHDAVMGGNVPLDKFIITKQLTKRPDEYADARSQPHVQLTKRCRGFPNKDGPNGKDPKRDYLKVALRRRAAGKRDGVMPGEAVPYVICVQRGSSETSSTEAQPAGEGVPDAGGKQPTTPQPAAVQQPANGSTTPVPAQASNGANAAVTPGAPSTTPGGAAPTAAAGHTGGGMGLAERAYHPEELIESGGRLMIDTEYYLGQQVHPVVSRLTGVLQGTDGARLAECLGLDPSRFKGSSNTSSHMDGGGADVFGFSSMDDDELYQGCEPLQLLAPNGGSSFQFKGALDVVLGKASPEQLLSPPDAVGDPQHTLTPQQLVNQVVLRARDQVVQYHDAWLDADDELAQDVADASNNAGPQQPGQTGTTGLRDIVLQPSGEPNKVPHPDTSRNAGVLLSRRMDERQLYLQLCHYQRLLNPELAVKRGMAQLKANNPKAVVTEVELRSRLTPIWPALRAASEAVDMLRLQSAYHWVDISSLFKPVKATIALGQA